jgi:hypothetical protein
MHAQNIAELLDEIRRRRSFRPSAAGAPDSTILLREDRERDALNCTPEELIETSWEDEWNPKIPEQT